MFTHPEVTKDRKERKMEREALLALTLTSKTMQDKATPVSGFPNQGTSTASWGQSLSWMLLTAPCSDSVWDLMFSFVLGRLGEHFPSSESLGHLLSTPKFTFQLGPTNQNLLVEQNHIPFIVVAHCVPMKGPSGLSSKGIIVLFKY